MNDEKKVKVLTSTYFWCCSWCWRCARTRAALGRSEAACRKVGQGRRKSSSLLPRHSSTLPLKLDTKSTRTPCFDKQCARKHWRSVQPSAEYISYLIYFTILMHCLHCSALAATPSREKLLLFLEVGADTRSLQLTAYREGDTIELSFVKTLQVTQPPLMFLILWPRHHQGPTGRFFSSILGGFDSGICGYFRNLGYLGLFGYYPIFQVTRHSWRIR